MIIRKLRKRKTTIKQAIQARLDHKNGKSYQDISHDLRISPMGAKRICEELLRPARLEFLVSDELYFALDARAESRNMTLEHYILECLSLDIGRPLNSKDGPG
jgi:hypothetical protein